MDEDGNSDEVPGGSTASFSRRQGTETSRQTAAYPRKRALKACQTCRMRKTKCNNERPVCGFCSSLGAICVYEDSKDISTLDPASQLIINRLDLVLEKLDETRTWPTKESEQAPQHCCLNPGGSTSRQDVVSSPKVGPTIETLDEDMLSVDDLNLDLNMMTPPCRTSPDAVLDWPVFESRYRSGYISDGLFTQGLRHKNSLEALAQSAPGSSFVSPSSINEESVPRLVEAFLARVHIKAPVLNVEVAREYSRTVAQEGVRWTGPSCLVLIMSALGSIAPPFSELYNPNAPIDSAMSAILLHGQSLAIGNVYYDAACKRIGMLEPSILTTQCIYLCGVYEMYNIRPLHAWRWFSQASSTLFMHLKCQDSLTRDNQNEVPSTDDNIQRLEASVYWSAYKSMCELRTEIALPASLLFEVDYPHILPTPPSNFSTKMGFDEESSPLFESTPESFSKFHDSEATADKLQEQAWFFYLTDIILSRLGTRVLLNMYDTEPSGWDDTKINRLIRAANEFEHQLKDWFEGLPEAIQFDDSDIRPDHELRFTVQARALEIKAWLYRPFLYYAIHHQPPPDVASQVFQFVQKAIDSSIHWILLRPIRHRHHGSWFVGRLVLSSALSIIAAVKAGLALDSLNDWRDIVREAISAMEFWSSESADFKRGGGVLASLQAELVSANPDVQP